MKKDLTGKLVVVTGGARGIGKASAKRFIEARANVLICDLDAEEAERSARELGARSAGLDVSDAEAFLTLTERTEREMGPVDILVNNAGIMTLGKLVDQPAKNDRKQIEVNIFGVLNGVRAVLPRMVRRGGGHIVNVASVAGRIAPPGAAVYAATKHAVLGLTEALRLEEPSVNFTCICPAPVNTELFAGAKRLPWPPLVQPEEVAKALVQAVVENRFEVYVPKTGVLTTFLPGLLPRRLGDVIGRLMGMNSMFTEIDREKRSEYAARVR